MGGERGRSSRGSVPIAQPAGSDKPRYRMVWPVPQREAAPARAARSRIKASSPVRNNDAERNPPKEPDRGASGALTFPRYRGRSLSDCHASSLEDDFLQPYVCESGSDQWRRTSCLFPFGSTRPTRRPVCSSRSRVPDTRDQVLWPHHVVRRIILT